MAREFNREALEAKAKKVITIGGGVGAILFIALVLFFMSFAPVPKGENGCIFSNTKGWDYNEKPQGWYFKQPIVQSMNRMSFQTRTLELHDGEKGSLGVLTPKDKNGINFNVDVLVRYRMDTNQICEFLELKGRDPDPLVLTALRADSTRGIFGKYSQEDIPENRIAIAEEIRTELQTRLDREKSGKLKDNFIIVEAIDIRNVQFASRIEEAIISKQEAKQEAEKREYLLEQAQKEKEIKIVNAEASKESSIIEAEGQGQAILIKASAQAEGIQKVNNAYQSMPTQYVEVKYAEALKEVASKGNSVIMDLGRFSSGNNLGIMDYNKLMGVPQVQQVIASE